MSNAIDNRVVQMEFDNQRFEKNVATSISTLDKLKAALKLDGATKGMQQIENYSRSFNLNGIGTAVETISSKFTLMGMIGVTALQNIVNKAVDAGERMVKALSIDQIMSGWNKYAEKTTSVQTIMAATAETWEKSAEATGFMGNQMEFVNSQMEKLNWFTDETSYNFTDMVSNIGKFTANQIPLEEAVTAMQGIANWAAISGQNAGAASRAMYNLAQAIGVGSVKLMDWKSIENANMATAGFKQKVLDVAVANGQLTKEVDKLGAAIYKTSKGTEVSIQNFSQTLSEGWFDKDTLISVLNEYGAFTDQLYEFSNATGLTATDILGLVEAQQKGTLSTADLQKAAADCGMSVEEFSKHVQNLASDENKFGMEAFKAAQEAKTFQDAIDATKDAASTKWMNIFENLFGDYEKARHLWTDFANFLYDVLVAPLEKVEALSKTLGRLDAVKRIATAMKDIAGFLFNGKDDGSHGILESLRTGFERVIPPLEITTAQIAQAIDKFRHFAATLKLTGKQSSLLRQAGQGLASVLLYVGNTIKNFWDATASLRAAIVNIASAIGELVLKLFASAKHMDTSGAKAEAFQKICDKLAEIINKVADAIHNLDLDKLKEKFSGVSGIIKGIVSAFRTLIDKITSINIGAAFGTAIDWIKEKFNALKEFLSTVDIKSALKTAFGIGVGGGVFAGFIKLIKSITDPFKSFTSLGKKVGGVLDSIGNAIKTFQKNVVVDNLKKIATSLLILAAALLVLGFVNYDKAITGLVAIGTILLALYGALQSIGDIDKAKLATLAAGMLIAAAAMLVMAVALAVLAGALALFALVAKMETIGEGLGIMIVTLFTVVAAMQVMSKMSPKVLVAAAALLVVAAALIVLAGALALFALAAKMDTIQQGFAYMATTLGLVVGVLILLGKAFENNIGSILAAAAALLVASAALLVLAAALAAFALIAKMSTAETGLIMLIAMLGALTIALLALGAAGPVVIAGAASLLIAAAACLVLAAAVAVVGLALPLLAAGLAALGGAIGLALTSIGQGAQDFLVSLSDALVAVGDALAEIVTTIAGSLGEAVSLLGEGVAEAITGIIASVGEGIGRGITAISDAIGTFGDNLSKSALGVESLGDSVRSLRGIDWLGTAGGVAELALAFKKLNKFEGVTEAITAMLTEVNGMASNLQTAGDNLGNSFIAGLNGKISVARTSGTALASNAGSGVSSSPSWDSIGANYGQGFVNGVRAKWGAAYAAGYSLGLAAKQGMEAAGEIASPSKVTRKLGGFFGIGWVKGILDKASDSEDAGREMVNRTVDAMARANVLVNDILSNDLQPRVSPVLDLSNVRNGLINLDRSMALAKDRLSTEVISKINMGMVGLSGAAPVSSGPVYNISIDGIKYNADDYVDSSIQNFVETMVRKNKMYTGR